MCATVLLVSVPYLSHYVPHCTVWRCLSHRVAHRQYPVYQKGVLAVYATRDDFYTGCRGSVAFRWDIASGKQTCKYEGHSKWVQCLSVHRSQLFTGSDDSLIKLWDNNTGECLRTFEGHTQVDNPLCD